uniref:Ribonuclease H1 n=1 Tax=Strigamia maritima TaxID=126957 RepID=T1J8V2_STRMM
MAPTITSYWRLFHTFRQLERLRRNIYTNSSSKQKFYFGILEAFRNIMGRSGGGFYAVAKGRKIGIYHTWDECKSQTEGYPGCKFKKFACKADATDFINEFQADLKPETQSIEYIPLGIPKLTPKIPNPEIFAEKSINPSSSPKKPRKVNPSKRQRLKLPSTTTNPSCISIYTDGACEANGSTGAKGGIGVYWGPNHRLNVSEPLGGRQTNNRAEIHAAIRAIKQAKSEGLKEINLHTDSQFLIKSITGWINKWKRNNWQLASGGPVKNKDDFEELDESLNGIKVHWIHVKGHSGIAGNEAADELARNAVPK